VTKLSPIRWAGWILAAGPLGAAGAESADPAAAGPSLFAVDPGLWFWTAVSFLVLLAVLARFSFRPIARAMERRERTIREALDQAEDTRRRSENLVAEGHQLIGEAQRKAQELIAAGQKAGEEARRQVLSQAQEQAGAMMDRAQSALAGEKQKAVRELQDVVANLSVQIASQLLKRELNPADHERLVRQFLDDLEKSHDHRPGKP